MAGGPKQSQAPVGYKQLTIDGGEVKHPPPRPRAKCEDCDKLITITRDGFYHHHHDGWGNVCPATGRRPRR